MVSTKRVAPCGGVVPPAMRGRRARPRTPWSRQHGEECSANVGGGVLRQARRASITGIRRPSWEKVPKVGSAYRKRNQVVLAQRIRNHSESPRKHWVKSHFGHRPRSRDEWRKTAPFRSRSVMFCHANGRAPGARSIGSGTQPESPGAGSRRRHPRYLPSSYAKPVSPSGARKAMNRL